MTEKTVDREIEIGRDFFSDSCLLWRDWLVAMGSSEAVGDASCDWRISSNRVEVKVTDGRGSSFGEGTFVSPSLSPSLSVSTNEAKGEGGYDGEMLANSYVKDCHSFEDVRRVLQDFRLGVLNELQESARNLVYTDGVESGVEVLVIGEAPGRDEDIEGKPFVGKSGRLLDKIFDSVDLSRQKQVMLTNVVYWRPPGNRNPFQSETRACLPFVKKTIELAAPKVILLTGRVPMQVVLGSEDAVGRVRGKWKHFETKEGKKIDVMVTFHPSYLLRSPRMKTYAWGDMISLKKRLMDVC